MLIFCGVAGFCSSAKFLHIGKKKRLRAVLIGQIAFVKLFFVNCYKTCRVFYFVNIARVPLLRRDCCHLFIFVKTSDAHTRAGEGVPLCLKF